jgi:hypothetical protein
VNRFQLQFFIIHTSLLSFQLSQSTVNRFQLQIFITHTSLPQVNNIT